MGGKSSTAYLLTDIFLNKTSTAYDLYVNLRLQQHCILDWVHQHKLVPSALQSTQIRPYFRNVSIALLRILKYITISVYCSATKGKIRAKIFLGLGP